MKLEVETIVRKLYDAAPAGIPCILAGESALAELTDLSKPEVTTLALSVSAERKWRATRDKHVSEGPNFEIEVWRDDPLFLADRKCVNPVSLALSLRKSRDPRIRLALSNLLRKHDLDPDVLGEVE
jgi:hypothetical protein